MVDRHCLVGHTPVWVDDRCVCRWCGCSPSTPIPTVADVLWFTLGAVGAVAAHWVRVAVRR
jgi:hypothetical protein